MLKKIYPSIFVNLKIWIQLKWICFFYCFNRKLWFIISSELSFMIFIFYLLKCFRLKYLSFYFLFFVYYLKYLTQNKKMIIVYNCCIILFDNDILQTTFNIYVVIWMVCIVFWVCNFIIFYFFFSSDFIIIFFLCMTIFLYFNNFLSFIVFISFFYFYYLFSFYFFNLIKTLSFSILLSFSLRIRRSLTLFSISVSGINVRLASRIVLSFCRVILKIIVIKS